MILRIKKLIMEAVPNEPGRSTNFETLYSGVDLYCNEINLELNKEILIEALRDLHNEQSIVYFSDDDIRPTQYGLNLYYFFGD